MDESPLRKAAKLVGGFEGLGALLGVTKGAAHQWQLPGRRVPAEHCPAIERATKGAVRCEDLRPDVDWAYLRAAAGTDEEPAPPAYTGPERRRQAA